MNIIHKSTRNITEYHFDLFPSMPEPLGSFRIAEFIGKVLIVFENGKFSRCDFPFKGTYNREQWSMLAEIENEIHRIELSLSQMNKKPSEHPNYDNTI
jgi:hypothetical protein